jgi:hypothetical protein
LLAEFREYAHGDAGVPTLPDYTKVSKRASGDVCNAAIMGRAVVANAYLRIFQRLDTLPEQEQRRWERHIVEGGQMAPRRPIYREGWTRGRLGVIVAEDDRPEVRFVDGAWYVCPSRTRIRLLASLLSLRETVPPEVADALVPEAEARRAARELAKIRRRNPRAVPTMLQSAWHVPVRWFVLVEDGERRMVERPDGGHRLLYWTSLGEARKRAERALEILRENELEVVAELIEDMVAWLSVFDPRSAVELDYADISDFLTPAELEDDHSALELQGALDALAEGDVDRAGDLYQTVAARWAEAKTRESLN